MNRDKIRARLRNSLAATKKAEGWYRIRNAAGSGGEPAEVYIYDEIGWIGHTAADLMAELRAITAPEITLRINSPGGEIFDGIAIYSQLRNHPARVTVQVDSLAASIASVIAQAGDRIVMQPFSQMMIHDGSGMCIGDAAEMMEMAELLDRQSDNIAAIYNERAGGGAKTWRQRMKAETWYTAEEAVAAGLADEVAKPVRQPGETARMAEDVWDLSLFRFPGRSGAPAPTNAAETVGQAIAGATPLPDDLEPAIVAPAPRAGGSAPQDELKHCPECDALVAESAMDDHREKEHGATDVLAVLAELTPPTGVLAGALRAGLDDPEFDADTFRATLASLVNEAPAVEPAAEVVELNDETCPECGASAPPGARECPDCGHALQEGSGDAEGQDDDLGATLAETVATVAAQAPAPEVAEVEQPAPDTSGWNAPPEAEPETTPAELARQAIEAVATEAPAEPAPTAPEPQPAAAQWREPEQPPEQTAPTNAWSDVGQTIAAAIRIQANAMGAPAEAPPAEAPEIEPHPDPVLLTRSIREEALR